MRSSNVQSDVPISDSSLLSEYPVLEIGREIVGALERGSNVILKAPTGSGKTTQIPILLQNSRLMQEGRILIVQDTIDLARESAIRVAKLTQTPVGERVGYLTGPEKQCSQDCNVVFVTAGVYKRFLDADPGLSKFSVVIFDEFDQRRLLVDLGLGHTLLVRNSSGSPRICVMSATGDIEALKEYLPQSTYLSTNQRSYDIKFQYLAPNAPRIPAAQMPSVIANTVAERLQLSSHDGTILAFLPTTGHIQKAIACFKKIVPKGVQVFPFFAQLPVHMRERVFSERQGPTVIFSTNLAERGLTIPNVGVVVDSGFQIGTSYDPERDSRSIDFELAPRDVLDQRAGRTGRNMSGTCIRLFTEADYLQRPHHVTPEIERTPARNVVLHEISLATHRPNFSSLPLLTPLPEPLREHGRRELYMIGAISSIDSPSFTQKGKELLKLGCDCLDAALLMAASVRGCADEMAIVVAMRLTKPIRTQNIAMVRDESLANWEVPPGSVSDLLNDIAVYRRAIEMNFDDSWCEDRGLCVDALVQVRSYHMQFRDRLRSHGYVVNESPAKDHDFQMAVADVFLNQLFVRFSRDRYRNIFTKELAVIGDSSCARSKYLIPHEIVRFQAGSRAVINQATVYNPQVIESPDWLDHVSKLVRLPLTEDSSLTALSTRVLKFASHKGLGVPHIVIDRLPFMKDTFVGSGWFKGEWARVGPFR
ncbi:MAG: DEAD/DEAH box helicase, partial [Bdellovibrionales bacterium]|nr:DEAD/DEAH box helicase [Bdellovibrionales bacterium]